MTVHAQELIDMVPGLVAALALCFLAIGIQPLFSKASTFEWAMWSMNLVGGGVTLYCFFFEAEPWVRQAVRAEFAEWFVTLGLLILVGVVCALLIIRGAVHIFTVVRSLRT